MRAHDSYDYAVIRVVPRVERGEFMNVGVIVSCEKTGYLKAAVELDEARLRALDPRVDLATLRRHLEAMQRICAGGPGAGPIGLQPQRARIQWLNARRSAITPGWFSTTSSRACARWRCRNFTCEPPPRPTMPMRTGRGCHCSAASMVRV